jgi:hypothetical protein
MHTFVSVYVHICSFFVCFFWVYLAAGCLTLCFSSIQGAFCACVKVLIFYHFLTCICLCFQCCLCVCVLCDGVHRQTNRHSREISEIVPAHSRARTHMPRSRAHPWAAAVTSVTLIRSRSSYTHTYTDTQVCMFVCLLFWVYLTAGYLTLIHSRSSYNHTYQHVYFVCSCIYLFIFCLLFWV